MMTTSDFAQRHGYEEGHRDFESPDYLPHDVRARVGYLILDQFAGLSNGQRRFVNVVQKSLPDSRGLLEWYDSIPFSRQFPDGPPVDIGREELQALLIRPLKNCDWRLFYAVVENVCAEWDRTGSARSVHFLPAFNYLLSCYAIPWELQGGFVIPVGDSEFAEELKFAREVAHPPVADHVSDPHDLIRDALAALYRKQGGTDNNTAVAKARDAWRAVVGAVSGYNPEKDAKKVFLHIQTNYPELNDTMKPWNDLMNAARHSASLNQRFPTEAEARFIVMLCVNAVRLLCPTCRSEDAA